MTWEQALGTVQDILDRIGNFPGASGARTTES